jgi:hypothetical protein
MNVTVLQVIVVVFALFAWSRAILRLRDRRISWIEFVFWSVIWSAAIISAILPQTANIVSHFFGINRPVDFAVYVSIILLFYLIFRLYVKQEQHAQEMTKLVRQIALRHPGKK